MRLARTTRWLLAFVAVAWTSPAGAADAEQDAAASEVPSGLVPARVEQLPEFPGSGEPRDAPVPAADPIESELRLQRSIAASLRGDTQQAIASLGNPESQDAAEMYVAAVWRLENGQVEEGVRLLESVSARPGAPPETQKFLAVGYLHLDDAVAAGEAADAYLRENPEDAYVQYVRGLAMLRQQQPEQARGALRQAGYDQAEVAKIEQVVMQAPVDVSQRRATIGPTLTDTQQRRRSAVGGRPPQRNYNATVLIAGEYDSNVPLQPRFSGLGSDIDHEDSRVLIASFLDLQLWTHALGNWGVIGSTFDTFQFDANEFNIQDYMGGTYLNAVLLDKLVGSFRYEFHHTLVDESRFASEHRVTPSLNWLGSRGHTTLFYEFNPVDARAPALIPAQEQSGDTHRVGLTQAIYTFGGDGRIYAGYQFADTQADGSDFDRSSHMVTGRIERPLPRNWIFDIDARYVWDDYDNPNSLDFFERPRDDERVELRTGLQKNFNLPVSLRFDYTYINNDSNTENLFGVRFYDYDRHIVSSQLIFTL